MTTTAVFLYLTLLKSFHLILLSHFHGLASRHFSKSLDLLCVFKTNTQSPFMFCGIVSKHLRGMCAQCDLLKTLCKEFSNLSPSILLISSSLLSSWWLPRSSLSLSSETTSHSKCNKQFIIITIIWRNYPPKIIYLWNSFLQFVLSLLYPEKCTIFI